MARVGEAFVWRKDSTGPAKTRHGQTCPIVSPEVSVGEGVAGAVLQIFLQLFSFGVVTEPHGDDALQGAYLLVCGLLPALWSANRWFRSAVMPVYFRDGSDRLRRRYTHFIVPIRP